VFLRVDTLNYCDIYTHTERMLHIIYTYIYAYVHTGNACSLETKNIVRVSTSVEIIWKYD